MNPQQENKKKNEENPVLIIAGKPNLIKHHKYLLKMANDLNDAINNLSVVAMNVIELSDACDKRFLKLEAKWKAYEDDGK